MSADAVPKCQYCGEPWHKGLCPRIKAIEYDSSGMIIERVEFHHPIELGITPDTLRYVAGILVAENLFSAADLDDLDNVIEEM